MSKNRKKHNQSGIQKIKDAQHRNDYFKRLGIFLKALTGEDVLALIPSEERERLYIVRTRPIIAEPEEGYDVPSELVEAVKGIVIWWFKYRPITIEKTNQDVYIAQYYAFGLSLSVYLLHLKKVSYKNSERVNALLQEHFGDVEALSLKIQTEIHKYIFPYLTLLFNNFCKHFFSFSTSLKENDRELRSTMVIRVKKYPAEKIRVVIHNKARMAYKVGWTFEDTFTWVETTPVRLGINSIVENQTIPVYIQMHAWNRLIERLDCIPNDIFALNIFDSIVHGTIIREKDNFLIEYLLDDIKLGYLVALLIDGKLIVRTFLFLTCSGTPEGKRLEELVGLQKLDTKYLKMDKLSTFMTAKISTNEELRSIFRKADCLHLLELFDNLEKYSGVHPDHSPLESISSYLKTNDIKLPEWEDEEEENIVSTLERSQSGPSPGEGVISL